MKYFAIVPRKDAIFSQKNRIMIAIAAAAILGMIVPLIMIDLCFRLYQAIYFRINGIPIVQRKDYIAIDRSGLEKLTWMQKFSCGYCDYANGLVAWIAAIVKTTEVYSCAIRHPRSHPIEEYQKDYYPYEDFV